MRRGPQGWRIRDHEHRGAGIVHEVAALVDTGVEGVRVDLEGDELVRKIAENDVDVAAIRERGRDAEIDNDLKRLCKVCRRKEAFEIGGTGFASTVGVARSVLGRVGIDI